MLLYTYICIGMTLIHSHSHFFLCTYVVYTLLTYTLNSKYSVCAHIGTMFTSPPPPPPLAGARAFDLDTRGPTTPMVHNVQCTGQETELSECAREVDQRTCDSSAGIVCQGLYS